MLHKCFTIVVVAIATEKVLYIVNSMYGSSEPKILSNVVNVLLGSVLDLIVTNLQSGTAFSRQR